MNDLVVVGGGQAGLAAAAHAAEQGLRVVVCEKTDRFGGSAAFSAGILWTAPDVETMRSVVPDGDPELGRLLVEGLEPAVDRVRDAGVLVTDRWYGQMGFGVAYRTDIHALHEHWQRVIVANGGELRANTPVRSLRFATVAWWAPADVEARAVLLATGGFQGDSELVKRFLGWDADRMPIRSNRGSTGDGFRLAASAGAAASRGLGGFYGHLVPDPLTSFEPEHYLPLTQYHSRYSILVDFRGRRFIDESLGDEVSNQIVLQLPGARAVLLCDERVRTEHVIGPPYPHGQVIDRFAVARSLGANLTSADTIEGADRAPSRSGASIRSGWRDARRVRERRRAGRAAARRAGAAGRAAVPRRAGAADAHVPARRRANRFVGARARPGWRCGARACIARAATRAACRARATSPGWRSGWCSARAPWMQ